MKRILAAGALMIWIVGCANNGGETGRPEAAGSDADTTKNMTTNSGAAGTGGVGAGFGAGGSAGTDTNTTPGAAKDTVR